MNHKRLPALLGTLVLTGIMGIIAVQVILWSPGTLAVAANPDTPDPSHREKESPNISFIDSPSATCYLPTAGTGACYIQWNYLYVTAASGSYIISMTVSIDDQMRAYHSGFFQNAMFIPSDMTAPGYKVSCGAPRLIGSKVWGNSYPYTIRARDTNGLKTANYGSVTCPADVPNIYMPFLSKN